VNLPLDAADRDALATVGVVVGLVAGGLLALAGVLGLGVRLFGLTSGLF
jgi:hypothetical protein